eukprot:jgi/Mesvir1/3915/Mv19857-RA.2
MCEPANHLPTLDIRAGAMGDGNATPLMGDSGVFPCRPPSVRDVVGMPAPRVVARDVVPPRPQVDVAGMLADHEVADMLADPAPSLPTSTPESQMADIHASNLAAVCAMTREEVEGELEDLRARFPPSALEMLRQRGARKLGVETVPLLAQPGTLPGQTGRGAQLVEPARATTPDQPGAKAVQSAVGMANANGVPARAASTVDATHGKASLGAGGPERDGQAGDAAVANSGAGSQAQEAGNPFWRLAAGEASGQATWDGVAGLPEGTGNRWPVHDASSGPGSVCSAGAEAAALPPHPPPSSPTTLPATQAGDGQVAGAQVAVPPGGTAVKGGSVAGVAGRCPEAGAAAAPSEVVRGWDPARIRFNMQGWPMRVFAEEDEGDGEGADASTATALPAPTSVVERDPLRAGTASEELGYSWRELVALARSTVAGQRVAALQMITAVLSNADRALHAHLVVKGYAGSRHITSHATTNHHADGEGSRGGVAGGGEGLPDGESVEQQSASQWGRLLDFAVSVEVGLPTCLRMALDDAHDTVVAAAAHATAALLSSPTLEEAADALEDIRGGERGIASAPATRDAQGMWRAPAEDVGEQLVRAAVDAAVAQGGGRSVGEGWLGTPLEEEEEVGRTVKGDAELCQVDAVAGLMRMGLLPRARYVLEVLQIPSAVDPLLSVLLACARHGPSAAAAVMACPRLVETLLSCCLPPRSPAAPANAAVSASAGAPAPIPDGAATGPRMDAAKARTMAKAVKLVKVLCMASKEAALVFEESGLLMSAAHLLTMLPSPMDAFNATACPDHASATSAVASTHPPSTHPSAAPSATSALLMGTRCLRLELLRLWRVLAAYGAELVDAPTRVMLPSLMAILQPPAGLLPPYPKRGGLCALHLPSGVESKDDESKVKPKHEEERSGRHPPPSLHGAETCDVAASLLEPRCQEACLVLCGLELMLRNLPAPGQGGEALSGPSSTTGGTGSSAGQPPSEHRGKGKPPRPPGDAGGTAGSKLHTGGVTTSARLSLADITPLMNVACRWLHPGVVERLVLKSDEGFPSADTLAVSQGGASTIPARLASLHGCGVLASALHALSAMYALFVTVSLVDAAQATGTGAMCVAAGPRMTCGGDGCVRTTMGADECVRGDREGVARDHCGISAPSSSASSPARVGAPGRPLHMALNPAAWGQAAAEGGQGDQAAAAWGDDAVVGPQPPLWSRAVPLLLASGLMLAFDVRPPETRASVRVAGTHVSQAGGQTPAGATVATSPCWSHLLAVAFDAQHSQGARDHNNNCSCVGTGQPSSPPPGSAEAQPRPVAATSTPCSHGPLAQACASQVCFSSHRHGILAASLLTALVRLLAAVQLASGTRWEYWAMPAGWFGALRLGWQRARALAVAATMASSLGPQEHPPQQQGALGWQGKGGASSEGHDALSAAATPTDGDAMTNTRPGSATPLVLASRMHHWLLVHLAALDWSVAGTAQESAPSAGSVSREGGGNEQVLHGLSAHDVPPDVWAMDGDGMARPAASPYKLSRTSTGASCRDDLSFQGDKAPGEASLGDDVDASFLAETDALLALPQLSGPMDYALFRCALGVALAPARLLRLFQLVARRAGQMAGLGSALRLVTEEEGSSTRRTEEGSNGAQALTWLQARMAALMADVAPLATRLAYHYTHFWHAGARGEGEDDSDDDGDVGGDDDDDADGSVAGAGAGEAGWREGRRHPGASVAFLEGSNAAPAGSIVPAGELLEGTGVLVKAYSGQGFPLPPTWLLSPLCGVAVGQGLPRDAQGNLVTDERMLEAVLARSVAAGRHQEFRAGCAFLLVLELAHSRRVWPLAPTDKFLFLCQAFLSPSAAFLQPDVKWLLAALQDAYCGRLSSAPRDGGCAGDGNRQSSTRRESSGELAGPAAASANASADTNTAPAAVVEAVAASVPLTIPDSASSEALGVKLADNFAAASYGDRLYGRQLALFLRPGTCPPGIRRTTWRALEATSSLYLLPPVDECVGGAAAYLDPPEPSPSMVEEYVRSLATGALDLAVSRGALPGHLALCHTRAALFPEHADGGHPGKAPGGSQEGGCPSGDAGEGQSVPSRQTTVREAEKQGGDEGQGAASADASRFLRRLVRGCSEATLAQLLPRATVTVPFTARENNPAVAVTTRSREPAPMGTLNLQDKSRQAGHYSATSSLCATCLAVVRAACQGEKSLSDKLQSATVGFH